MAARSLSDAVTDSFYAWEIRGRGWTLAEEPVSLEPPFRPLLMLPQFALEALEQIDDGKRPTLGSVLLDRTKRLFTTAPKFSAPEPYVEQPPFPAFPRGEIATLRILVPPEFVARSDVMAQLLAALSASETPLSFEVIGTAGTVTIQIACDALGCEGVRAHIEGFMPDVSVIQDDDRLAALWDDAAAHLVVDFGLAHEFFLPLSTGDDFRIDPYVPLVAALANARAGEVLMLQLLVERARNPWATAIFEALDDGEGGCLIADAPWFVAAARAKTETTFYAAVLRIGAQAASPERAWDLIQSTQAFILQYANPSGNALVPLENDGYPDDAHAQSLLARASFRTGMLVSVAELVPLFHLPDQSVRHRALGRSQARTKELPRVAVGHELMLGEHRHRGQRRPASLDLESRFAHTWIVGGSGTGKSTLLANLILQDIVASRGIAVLDPHGDLVDDIVAQIPERFLDSVILFDPADVDYPIGFNILDARTEIERNLLAADLVAIFRRYATSWGDTMSTVLGEAVLAVLTHPEGGTLIDLKHFLIDVAFRKSYLAQVPEPDVHFFWEKEYPVIGARSIGPLLSRLDAFLRSRIVRNIVGQANAKLDLGEAMRSGKVVLARLAKGLIGEENSSLLGSLLVAKFNQLALARQEIPKDARRPFFCYADEFQHFVTPSMESLATEGRKYRFGLTLAHQTLAQLTDLPKIESTLLANCHTRIVFRVGEGDAKKLSEGFSFFEASDLAVQSRGEAIVRIGGAANDFNLRTYQPSVTDEGEADERRRTVIDLARARYAVPRAELMVRVSSAHSVAADELRQESICNEPQAEASVLAAPEPIASVTSAAPDANTPMRAQKAALRPPTESGRGGAMHKYLQHLIKRLAEERGFRAAIEDAAEGGRADVVLRRNELVVGCEISITTNAEHEAGNLRKCLAAGFNRVLFISPERKLREKIAVMLRNEMVGAPVAVIGPEDIVTALDGFGTSATTSESTVRGYKVKVTRQEISPQDEAARRKAVAGVIARTMRK